MKSSVVQMVCGALGVIGLIGIIRCCTIPQWILIVNKGVNTLEEHHAGLWMWCVRNSTGELECELWNHMSSPELQPFRAMTIISCIVSGISLVFLFFGSDFTTCVQNKDAKPKILLVAGLGLLLAGLMIIIPVSWVAHDCVTGLLFARIGASIYIGWGAGVAMILAGGLLCYFRRPRSSSSGGTAKFNLVLKGLSAVQIECVAFGVIGMIGVIVCCALPLWKVSSFKESNILTAQETQAGLWMECVKQSTGQQQCKVYDSMLELSSDLQAARAMTIISCMLSGLSLLIVFFGADFTTCVQNKDAKPKISLVAGVGLLLAGLLVIIPVSWSAHVTVRDFHDQFVPAFQKKEMGACIYIGWAAGALLILAGSLLCYFSRPKFSSSGGTARYYNNSTSAPNRNIL